MGTGVEFSDESGLAYIDEFRLLAQGSSLSMLYCNNNVANNVFSSLLAAAFL